MGCFSYICKQCKTPINAGERCVIFLLDKGDVVEYQRGVYDNYGSVEEAQKESYSCSGDSWHYKDWVKLVDMHFSDDVGSGFALFHEACYKDQIPKSISEDDPNQGWGKLRQKFLEKKDIFKNMPKELKKRIFAQTI